jgi:serine/threonine-protein kinase
METVMAVLQRDPPALRAADASLDADLERITMRCLRKRAEQRYATAADLADALGRWQRGERTPRSFTQRLRSWIGGR